MEGSGDDPVDSDPDPAINEVSEVTEALDAESVDKDTMEEMEKGDEEAMAEMEANDSAIGEDEIGDEIDDGNMDEGEEKEKDKDEEYTPQKDPKCQKCARPIYKERHEEYCRACEEASGDNVTEEVSMAAEDIKKKKKCEKCSRKGFMKKNKEFCDTDCKKENSTDAIEGEELEFGVEETTSQLNLPTLVAEPEEEEGNTIQNSGKKKCEKCLRKGFMKKNKKFCDTECKKEDAIEGEELEDGVEETTSQLNLPTLEADQEEEEGTTIQSSGGRKGSKERDRKCEKCSKKGFMKKNKDFCNSDCKNMEGEDNNSGKKKKQHGQHKQNKKKEKKKGNKDMKKGKKDKLKEEEKPEEKLGPLENLIKFLIKRNTYNKNH